MPKFSKLMLSLAACALLVSCSGQGQPDDEIKSTIAKEEGETSVIEQSIKASNVVIYLADRIQTMDANRQLAEAVAVDGGKIAGVGTLDELTGLFAGAVVDKTFADKTIIPGLIDPHIHILLAAMEYAMPFATPWPMAIPQGMSQAYPDRASFLARVAEIVAEAPEGDAPVFVYGYHNLLQGDLTVDDLDQISTDRRIIIMHYSAHDFFLNSKALAFSKITPELHERFEGIGLKEDGTLNGRVYEDALQYLLGSIGGELIGPAAIKKGLGAYFSIVRDAGITTVAELAYGAFDRASEDNVIGAAWSQEKSGFKLFIVPEHRSFEREFGADAPSTIAKMVSGEIEVPAPVLPRVKFFTDAAFYSQTMKISEPGYLSGQSKGTDGLWVMKPDEITSTIMPYWENGLSAHVHSNGDAAQSATLAALAELRTVSKDNDFVIEHGGLFSPTQIEKAATLDLIVSAASHYVFYMANDYKEPLGSERAAWISPLGAMSAADLKVTLHSDAPLAPPQPLRAAGVHITRLMRTGEVYEPEQSLEPYDALEAVTLDAARALGLEDKIGSIEVGKQADFTILARDPLQTPGQNWQEIGIWGVVLDGELRPLD